MENRYSIEFALQHSNSGTPVPDPSDPVPPAPVPDPYPLVIPGNRSAEDAIIDVTGAMTPVSHTQSIDSPKDDDDDDDDDDDEEEEEEEEEDNDDTHAYYDGYKLYSDDDKQTRKDRRSRGREPPVVSRGGPAASDLLKALQWIPPYLEVTAYGERFHTFASHNKAFRLNSKNRGTHKPQNGSSTQPKSTIVRQAITKPEAFASPAPNPTIKRSVRPTAPLTIEPSQPLPPLRSSYSYLYDSDSHSRHRGHTLPQIFPSRTAVELDASGLWGVPLRPSTEVHIERNGLMPLSFRPFPLTERYDRRSGETSDDDSAANSLASLSKADSELLTPRCEAGLPPLPTHWALRGDAEHSLTVENEPDSSTVRFFAKPSDGSMVTVRTDLPIPPLCGVYYYEVTILEHGIDEFLSVGFCDAEALLTKIPGCEQKSWGYHSDDGRITACQGTASSFGPKFGKGDVVGCGINFSRDTVFYTKNGLPLGTAFQGVRGVLYPCIGMKYGEVVRTNFGHTAFSYDIDKYLTLEKDRLLRGVSSSRPMSRVFPDLFSSNTEAGANVDEWDFIKDMVSSYLTHVGYLETAEELDRERRSEETSFKDEAKVNGNAMDVDEPEHPVVSEPTEQKRLATVDVMNRRRIRSCVLDGDIDGALKLLGALYPAVLDNHIISFKLRCRKFVELVRRCSPHEKENGTEGTNGKSKDKAKARTSGITPEELIAYGQKLREDYWNDTDPYIVETLSAVFALLAYEDPGASRELAYLLDTDELAPLAEEINSAILVSQGKPAVPSLQRLVQQTTQLVWELSDQGVHSASLLSVKDDFVEF